MLKSKKPLVSIITVVYNGDKYLEKSINSVLNQTYPYIEYIIIDGCSKDKTIDIIKKYEDRIDYWISEEDNGIYDAMNKGLRAASGEYICILNADDYYEKSFVELSIKEILQTASDYSFANAKFVDSDNIIRAINPLRDGFIYQEMPYPHVTACISKKIYDEIGFFDTQFKIAGDHDLALRIHLKNYKYCYIDKLVANLEKGGISSDTNSTKESLHVAIKNGKNIFAAYTTYYIQIIKIMIFKYLPTNIIQIIQKFKKSRFR